MKQMNKSAMVIAISMAMTSIAAKSQDDSSKEFALEEVVITAQKREESLQEVPVSVQVVTGAELLNANIQGFEDMAQSVPSLDMINAAQVSVIAVRGISSADNRGFEQSVGLFIDGVHQPRERLYRATSFLDVQNVQVLRGPQGTLFGKNTTAGALIVTSAKPTDEFEGNVTTTYKFDNSADKHHNGGYNVEGYVSGALTDTLSARMSFRQLEDEGYYTNITSTGKDDVDDKTQSAGRVSLDWHPSDTFSALLKLEVGRSNTDGEGVRTYNVRNNAISEVTMAPVDAMLGLRGYQLNQEGSYTQTQNKGFDNTDTQSTTLSMAWNVGEYTIESITGYSEYEYKQTRDGDFTEANWFSQLDTEDYRVFSQEVRLLSPTHEAYDYVAGIYYQSATLDSLNDRIVDYTDFAIPLAISHRNYKNDSESLALFFNVNYDLSDQWTVSLGANYSYESKEAQRQLTIDGYAPLLNAFGEFDHEFKDERDIKRLNSSVKLQYAISDDYMVYGSVSQSYKSGGFDETGTQGALPGEYNPADGPANFEFDDEKLISAEIGGKGMFLEGRLSMNWAIFNVEVQDRQFSRYVPGTGFYVGNSGQVTYRGVEIDSNYLISENLRWDLSVTNLRGEIDEPISAGPLDLESKGPTEDPEWRVNTKLHYDYYFDELVLRSNLEMVFLDDQQFTSSALGRSSDLRTNLRLGLGDEGEVWELALIVKNITDEETVQAAQVIAVSTASDAGPNTAAHAWVREPRTYALQFKYNF